VHGKASPHPGAENVEVWAPAPKRASGRQRWIEPPASALGSVVLHGRFQKPDRPLVGIPGRVCINRGAHRIPRAHSKLLPDAEASGDSQSGWSASTRSKATQPSAALSARGGRGVRCRKPAAAPPRTSKDREIIPVPGEDAASDFRRHQHQATEAGRGRWAARLQPVGHGRGCFPCRRACNMTLNRSHLRRIEVLHVEEHVVALGFLLFGSGGSFWPFSRAAPPGFTPGRMAV